MKKKKDQIEKRVGIPAVVSIPQNFSGDSKTDKTTSTGCLLSTLLVDIVLEGLGRAIRNE